MKCRVSSAEGEGLSTRRGFLEEAAQMEDGIGRGTKGKGIIVEEGKIGPLHVVMGICGV